MTNNFQGLRWINLVRFSVSTAESSTLQAALPRSGRDWQEVMAASMKKIVRQNANYDYNDEVHS